MDHYRQSVLSAHCIGVTDKKQKERAAQSCWNKMDLVLRMHDLPCWISKCGKGISSKNTPGFSEILIPNFLGTDYFAGSIPALLVTNLLSKIFVQKRSQLNISGMDPGRTTCRFCQKSEELMDFW